MKAADTNVLVRLALQDDPAQLARAVDLLREGGLFVPLTVALETEWVLRTRPGWAREDVSAALRGLLRQPLLQFEAADLVVWAAERHAAGADFADMLHLVAARGRAAFATFDRRLARDAAPHPPLPIETV